VIAPGSWLGVMGGGQLGRMFAAAAQRLGYKVMVIDPDPDCPASAVADAHLCARLDDAAALQKMSRTCKAVTIETENVPVAAMCELERHLPVKPGAECVAIAQDRIREKRFLKHLGIDVAPHAAIECLDDLRAERIVELLPGILKLSREGYDGKGQCRVTSCEEVQSAFAQWRHAPCVLEKKIPLRVELSVLVSRNDLGETATWPVAENHHANGILDMSIVPARVPQSIAAVARDTALRIAAALRYRGVLCVEFFVSDDGDLLVNEIAPRPHNSGHYSIDACYVSQFEQQVRVLVDLTLGGTQLHSPAVMQNLLGELWGEGEPAWETVLGVPGAQLHLYGKVAPRPGRKMGHYTCIAASAERALANSARIRNALVRSGASTRTMPQPPSRSLPTRPTHRSSQNAECETPD
jgi:5-(carboxyamino)imidazole ribonucleotide synthase